MKTLNHFSVKHTNSFGVESIAAKAYFPSCIDDLVTLSSLLFSPSLSNFYILGEGYNTLFVNDVSPTIIKPEFLGIEIEYHETFTIVKAGASENWHNLVKFCIKKGINGLENLALIPGSVGAAPVQNIGAYGVELAQYCQEVLWFDFEKKQLVNYQHKDCQFAYRESIFKNKLKNKGIITSVRFCFPKNWQPSLSYSGLDHLPVNVSAQKIMNEVIKIRQTKLPDPLKLPNAGSFFKNPVIEHAQWHKLIQKHPEMPSYSQHGGSVKVAAGWLIEQAGFKGYQANGVGVHIKQALVLVNHHAKQGKHIVNLAKLIMNEIQSKFGISLEPEVRSVFPQGELSLVENKHG